MTENKKPDLKKDIVLEFKDKVKEVHKEFTDIISRMTIKELHHQETKSALDLFLAGLNATIKFKEAAMTSAAVSEALKSESLHKIRDQLLGKVEPK